MKLSERVLTHSFSRGRRFRGGNIFRGSVLGDGGQVGTLAAKTLCDQWVVVRAVPCGHVRFDAGRGI